MVVWVEAGHESLVQDVGAVILVAEHHRMQRREPLHAKVGVGRKLGLFPDGQSGLVQILRYV